MSGPARHATIRLSQQIINPATIAAFAGHDQGVPVRSIEVPCADPEQAIRTLHPDPAAAQAMIDSMTPEPARE